ncbi:hypothetical protein ARMGADRAFT_267796 [Armillaria gallica]|uniref:Uncharacterized protein n=1 Tax=Armillaria gallica TaxID=47427 RepID=A0A2H3E966_ARMGA|nr:hypothetical protein ARMGADRAFT_267796 [Armillaria gallica]
MSTWRDISMIKPTIENLCQRYDAPCLFRLLLLLLCTFGDSAVLHLWAGIRRDSITRSLNFQVCFGGAITSFPFSYKSNLNPESIITEDLFVSLSIRDAG